MKVYLTYEMNSGELVCECDSVTDTECFNSLATAIDHTMVRIEQGIEDGFVVDHQTEDIYDVINDKEESKGIFYDRLFTAIREDFECGHYFSLVMFRGYQENWQCYYTIVLEEKDLQ